MFSLYSSSLIDLTLRISLSSIEPSPSSSVVDIVAATENEAREDQVGDDADVMQELASTSRDVVIHVASDNIVSL